MKDDRTEQEKYSAWVRAVNACHEKGWKHIHGWIFRAPKGTAHDLSAANLEMLNDIEKRGIFIRTIP